MDYELIKFARAKSIAGLLLLKFVTSADYDAEFKFSDYQYLYGGVKYIYVIAVDDPTIAPAAKEMIEVIFEDNLSEDRYGNDRLDM